MLKTICLITMLTISGIAAAQPIVPDTSAQPAAMQPETAQPDSMQPVDPVVVKVEQPEPIWKSSSFWIGVVGGPMVSIILAVLLAFGVISRKQLDWLKQNKIVEIADKVVTQFEKFAAGTSVKWDDALAHALRAVVDRVGALSEGEEALVKQIVAGRIMQAEAKTNGKETATDVEKSKEEPKPEKKPTSEEKPKD